MAQKDLECDFTNERKGLDLIQRILDRFLAACDDQTETEPSGENPLPRGKLIATKEVVRLIQELTDDEIADLVLMDVEDRGQVLFDKNNKLYLQQVREIGTPRPLQTDPL